MSRLRLDPIGQARRHPRLLALATTASLALAATAFMLLTGPSTPASAVQPTAPTDSGKPAWFRCNGEFIIDGHSAGCFERMSATDK